MSELSDDASAESATEVSRRAVLRGTAGLAVGAAVYLTSGPEAVAAAVPDVSTTPAVVVGQLAAAAQVAATQHPLLRRKQLRAFEVMDVDGDGFVTPSDTARLVKKFAELTAAEDSDHLRQLTATIDRIWHALVDKPRWVPDLERLDAEQWVTAMANSVAVTPDKTLQYITVLTNLSFAMAGTSQDGVITKEEALRVGTSILHATPEEAEATWSALATADPDRMTYAEGLIAFTDFVTSTDPRAPGNLLLGKI